MKNYWDSYYKNIKGNSKPTSFSQKCLKFLKNYKGDMFDIGCGNGRDTIFFNRLNLNCYGLDQSSKAIEINKKKFKKYKKRFFKSDFVKYPFHKIKKNFSIYSRFTIHSINRKQEKEFFKKIHKLKNIDYLFIEVRTIYDDLFGQGKKISKNEFFTSHYRRFIYPIELSREVKKSFTILEYKVSKGLAVFKKENPKVMRIIAKKKI